MTLPEHMPSIKDETGVSGNIDELIEQIESGELAKNFDERIAKSQKWLVEHAKYFATTISDARPPELVEDEEG